MIKKLKLLPVLLLFAIPHTARADLFGGDGVPRMAQV